MMRWLLWVMMAMACALPASAQPSATPKPATVKVALDTSEGRFVLELEREKAPITVGNFLRYVDQKRLDGTVFYRTVRVAPNFGFVQFGVQNAPKRVLPPIKHEPTTQTGIKHLDGTISTARLAPGSARGDFTIMLGDQPSMDADPTKPGDNLGYAAFGRVIEGMDVIRKINEAPTAPGGTFKGEMLAKPVRIVSARRLP
ncbi:peptidylprolyl isomerase [Nostoc sp. 3335mG]|nr:peptidylprolyl isomerase [Nostoc sp. 3335mG]